MNRNAGWIVRAWLACVCCGTSLQAQTVQVKSELDQAVTAVAASISAGASGSEKRTVAVIGLVDKDGVESALGQTIAEKLITELLNVAPEKFEVIERRQLDKVLAEQKLTRVAVFDQEKRALVGKLLSVQELVTGTIIELAEDKVEVHARRISVESGRIVASGSVQFQLDSTMRLLNKKPAVAVVAPKSPAKPGVVPMSRSVVDDLLVEVASVKRKGSSEVEIELVFTAMKRDLDIRSSSRSQRLITDQGMAYLGQTIAVGTSSGGKAESVLVTEVATKARVTFKGVGTDATAISRLDLRGEKRVADGDKWAEWTIVVNDLPISK